VDLGAAEWVNGINSTGRPLIFVMEMAKKGKLWKPKMEKFYHPYGQKMPSNHPPF